MSKWSLKREYRRYYIANFQAILFNTIIMRIYRDTRRYYICVNKPSANSDKESKLKQIHSHEMKVKPICPVYDTHINVAFVFGYRC